MRPEFLPSVSWVDAIIVLLLILGLRRGLARGISEEIFDLLKWLAGLVCAAYFYMPLGNLLAQRTTFLTHHFCYVSVYLILLMVVRLLISFLHIRFGTKLLNSDAFGKAEYPLGTIAGACRYACFVLVLLALFNGRYYTQEEIRAQIVAQKDLFGSTPFPTTGAIQREIFEDSMVGAAARRYVPMLLIQPTAGEDKNPLHAGIGRAREQQVYEILESR